MEPKRKRGRPTVAAKLMDEEWAAQIKSNFQDKTTRTQAARQYQMEVYGLLSEAASDIPYLDGIWGQVEMPCGGPPGLKMKSTIIEQLGRMLAQDHYSKADVITVAKIAAKAYHDGCTVKEIVAYIQHGRNTGKW